VSDAEDFKENIMAELNAVPYELFADCFRNSLNGSTNIFRLAEITLNRNKTIFYFIVIFYLFFHTNAGTLLPNLVYYIIYIK
jgi:hypothetical protein